MRSAVPILVILSLTHANQKYRKKLVAYTFWHHYRTNFVKTKFFSHYSEPSCRLRLPRQSCKRLGCSIQFVIKRKKNMILKICFLAYYRILDRHFKRCNLKTVWQAVSSSQVTMHIHINVSSHSIFLVWKQKHNFETSNILCVRRRNCGTWSQRSWVEVELRNVKSQYISCVEAELQDFHYSLNSHNSLCAKAELKVSVQWRKNLKYRICTWWSF